MRRLMTAGCVLVLAAALATGCNTSKKAEEATTAVKAETAAITVDYGKGLNEDGTMARLPQLCEFLLLLLPLSRFCHYKSMQLPGF